VHTALCHKDKRVQSAARQARGAMIGLGTISNVRTIEQLARKILPKLDYPEMLGGPSERLDILIVALYQLREAQLISVHRKTAHARITTKGVHADSQMLKQRSNPGRQHGRRAPAFTPA
jgi:hypothetical protein